MSNDIDIKALWQQQPDVPAPDTKELFEKAAMLKSKTRNKLIKTNLLLILTCVFIIMVGWDYHPKMITTKIGILLMVIAMVTYLLVYNRMIPMLLKNDIGTSTQEYLQQFIRIKQRQEFLHTTMLTIYFILLTTGLFLYFIEFAVRMNVMGKVAVYGLTSFWLLFNWFYIRPRTIKKQQAPVDAMISKLKAINDQFSV